MGIGTWWSSIPGRACGKVRGVWGRDGPRNFGASVIYADRARSGLPLGSAGVAAGRSLGQRGRYRRWDDAPTPCRTAHTGAHRQQPGGEVRDSSHSLSLAVWVWKQLVVQVRWPSGGVAQRLRLECGCLSTASHPSVPQHFSWNLPFGVYGKGRDAVACGVHWGPVQTTGAELPRTVNLNSPDRYLPLSVPWTVEVGHDEAREVAICASSCSQGRTPPSGPSALAHSAIGRTGESVVSGSGSMEQMEQKRRSHAPELPEVKSWHTAWPWCCSCLPTCGVQVRNTGMPEPTGRCRALGRVPPAGRGYGLGSIPVVGETAVKGIHHFTSRRSSQRLLSRPPPPDNAMTGARHLPKRGTRWGQRRSVSNSNISAG